jgi:hypothetical protein
MVAVVVTYSSSAFYRCTISGMDEQPTNCDPQRTAQVQALERMVALANELEKVVDQLIEGIFTTDSDDGSSRSFRLKGDDVTQVCEEQESE